MFVDVTELNELGSKYYKFLNCLSGELLGFRNRQNCHVILNACIRDTREFVILVKLNCIELSDVPELVKSQRHAYMWKWLNYELTRQYSTHQ